jgi:hypothetical protein
LGPQFDLFIASIDWVAPKPTTFRINLKNNENFYLVYTPRTFIAEIEGKKYYLLNLNEQENAENAIARMLRYGAPILADLKMLLNLIQVVLEVISQKILQLT